MNRALFLDRDGTLIVDKVYLADPGGVEVIPGASEGLRRARALGFKLFGLHVWAGRAPPMLHDLISGADVASQPDGLSVSLDTHASRIFRIPARH